MDKRFDGIKQRFLEDTKDHVLKILNDNGVHRCLLFINPKSNSYYIYITTWPGHLCISGDMGCTVFLRLYDMFEFFSDEKINPQYWKEKIVSGSGREKGAMEWSKDAAEEFIMREFDSWAEDKREAVENEIAELREQIADIESEVASGDYKKELADSEIADLNNKIKALGDTLESELSEEKDKIASALINACDSREELGMALSDYENSEDGVDFSNSLYELSSCYDYTHHYIWQCYAILHVIALYNKEATAAGEVVYDGRDENQGEK